MAACLGIGAIRVHALEERNNANNLFRQEREELVFPAARFLEWLNQHTEEVLNQNQPNILRAFQTPGRPRNDPGLIARGVAAAIWDPTGRLSQHRADDDASMIDAEDAENIQSQAADEPQEQEIDARETQHNNEQEQAQPAAAEDEDVPYDAEAMLQPPTALVQDAPMPSTTRLYTDSEIGSPSPHATPDVPVRHASMTFASLPPRDAPQTTRQQSLGLDSDATEEDPVYVRAPELVAHEERMRAYEEPTPQPSPQSSHQPSPQVINTPSIPVFFDPSTVAGPSTRRTRSMTRRDEDEQRLVEEAVEEARIHELRRSLSLTEDELYPRLPQHQPTEPVIQEENMATPQEEDDAGNNSSDDQFSQDEQAVDLVSPAEEEAPAVQAEQTVEEPAQESVSATQAESTDARDTAAERSRLRAPRNLGRPVRPTTTMSATQQIRIRSLAQSRPVNNAPVAAHNNSDARRVRPRPPTQFVSRPTRPQPPPPKSFLSAQRKKEEDERAAARDAALKEEMRRRQKNKIEELRTKKREEQEILDREARRKSDEHAQNHLRELDLVPPRIAAFETRQEREESAAAEEKRINRQRVIDRQNALQGRVYGSSSIRPLTTIDLNQPARPASRLDMHDDEANDDEPTPTNNNQQRRIQDRESTQAPTRAGVASTSQPQRHVQRQSQQENSLPSYPNNLHRAPIRGSYLPRAPVLQTTSQAAPSALNNFPAPPTRAPAPDMRQYATQRPPMANDLPPQPPRAPQQAQQAQQSQQGAGSSSVRPGMQSMRTMRLIQAIKESSPIPSNISLPEIHTDSSDESDRASLPSWVSPGHIQETLASQETYDTDRIFGPIKRVAIDDVFGAMPPEKRQRLNLRTSSANWVRTGDALTQIEVIEDRAGREAIKNAGGWVYGISDYHNHDVRSYNRNMN